MKENTKTFFRSFKISFTIMLCLVILAVGISKAYVKIRMVGFAEYKNAVEYSDGVLRILDFTFNLNP